MEDSAFSDEFCRFIQTVLPSVDAAELLLALYESPDTWWTPAVLAAKLRPASSISDADAQRYLDQFQARGMIAAGPDKSVQFRPADERLREQVRTLAQAYKERPVTLIRMIYALRDARIQTFADAFKLRRE
jgi:hypothetical protein